MRCKKPPYKDGVDLGLGCQIWTYIKFNVMSEFIFNTRCLYKKINIDMELDSNKNRPVAKQRECRLTFSRFFFSTKIFLADHI